MQTQSGVMFRLYVKCRGGERVCDKRVLSLGHFFLFFFVIFVICF